MSGHEWQPIETAPKETSVLVTDGKHVFVAEQTNISGRDPCWVWYAMVGREIASSGDYGPSAMLEDHAYGTHPTHWMPLPELPDTADNPK